MTDYIIRQMFRLHLEGEEQRFITLTALASKYLPAIVDKFILTSQLPEGPNTDLIGLQYALRAIEASTIYTRVLSGLLKSEYFFKYLHSEKQIAAGGRRLAPAILKLVVVYGPLFDVWMGYPDPNHPLATVWNSGSPQTQHDIEQEMTEMLEFFYNVFLCYTKESRSSIIKDVHPGIKKKFLTLLQAWSNRCPEKIFGKVAAIVHGIVTDKPRAIGDGLRLRHEWGKRDICSYPGCEATTNLKACSR